MVFEHLPIAFAKSHRDPFDGNGPHILFGPTAPLPVQKMRN